MRIDMKRAAEVNERKGLTWRTLLASVWFVLCVIIAYFLTGWLVSSGKVTAALIYDQMGIPETVSMSAVRLISVLLIVIVLQFIAVIAFAMANPEARVRSGRPTAVAQSQDYYEQQYSRRA